MNQIVGPTVIHVRLCKILAKSKSFDCQNQINIGGAPGF